MRRRIPQRRDRSRRIRYFAAAAVALTLVSPASVLAQTLAVRLGIIQADERHAANPRDLQTIRTGTRSRDGDTARLAVRALGRLGRATVIPDILAALRHNDPAVRAEAAQAIAEGTRRAAATASPRSAPLDLASDASRTGHAPRGGRRRDGACRGRRSPGAPALPDRGRRRTSSQHARWLRCRVGHQRHRSRWRGQGTRRIHPAASATRPDWRTGDCGAEDAGAARARARRDA